MLTFTSLGDQVDKAVNRAKGHYIFMISGQNYHHIGSLLSQPGKSHSICPAIYMILKMRSTIKLIV